MYLSRVTVQARLSFSNFKVSSAFNLIIMSLSLNLTDALFQPKGGREGEGNTMSVPAAYLASGSVFPWKCQDS